MQDLKSKSCHGNVLTEAYTTFYGCPTRTTYSMHAIWNAAGNQRLEPLYSNIRSLTLTFDPSESHTVAQVNPRASGTGSRINLYSEVREGLDIRVKEVMKAKMYIGWQSVISIR
jgi:hypothetical protein